MQKAILFLLFITQICVAQKSDFESISFYKADKIAKETKAKNLVELTKLTLTLTSGLETDIEKVRAIYKWICTNIASDFKLYYKNERNRKKFEKDSIKLEAWNSELKSLLFKKLIQKKRTICTGYAYLFKEMCDVAGIKSKMIYGFGRTRDVLTFDPKYPNHTWNAVLLNNKWYLCDPTWSAGIAYAEDNKFKFAYNDGYFLTEPSLFMMNHFPINMQDSLLENPPTFDEFTKLPLLYGDAYLHLEESLAPKVMMDSISKNSKVTFAYKLKKTSKFENVLLVLNNGSSDVKKQIEPKLINNLLEFSHTFEKEGLYDVHLYFDESLIATYVIKVKKQSDY